MPILEPSTETVPKDKPNPVVEMIPDVAKEEPVAPAAPLETQPTFEFKPGNTDSSTTTQEQKPDTVTIKIEVPDDPPTAEDKVTLKPLELKPIDVTPTPTVEQPVEETKPEDPSPADVYETNTPVTPAAPVQEAKPEPVVEAPATPEQP